MNKKLIVRIVLIIWVIIWAVFLVRPFFKKSLIKEYSVLLKLPIEAKRAYVLGEDLHRFVAFCSDSITGRFSYKVVGLDEDSIECRRIKYYLYPSVTSKEQDFILVYKTSNFSQKGYRPFKFLNPETFILERIR